MLREGHRPLGRVAAQALSLNLPRTYIHGDITMRRVIVPALLAIAMVASSSVNASAFGLLDKLCNKGCDSCCDAVVEPACGCEAPCAPACGCEVAADPCCDSGCSRPKLGLLKKLFAKHHSCCDAQPACGCEVIEPACGCEAPACGCAAAPTCGCEVVDSCCDAPKCGGKVRGLLAKLFHKNSSCCDSGCAAEPTCGCEAPCAAEPTCGCEPSCGFGR